MRARDLFFLGNCIDKIAFVQVNLEVPYVTLSISGFLKSIGASFRQIDEFHFFMIWKCFRKRPLAIDKLYYKSYRFRPNSGILIFGHLKPIQIHAGSTPQAIKTTIYRAKHTTNGQPQNIFTMPKTIKGHQRQRSNGTTKNWWATSGCMTIQYYVCFVLVYDCYAQIHIFDMWLRFEHHRWLAF